MYLFCLRFGTQHADFGGHFGEAFGSQTRPEWRQKQHENEDLKKEAPGPAWERPRGPWTGHGGSLSSLVPQGQNPIYMHIYIYIYIRLICIYIYIYIYISAGPLGATRLRGTFLESQHCIKSCFVVNLFIIKSCSVVTGPVVCGSVDCVSVVLWSCSRVVGWW